MQRIVAEPETIRRFLSEIKESPVGDVHVSVQVTNPFDDSRAWEGEFLVDTGSTESWVPEDVMSGIGVDALNVSRVWLADSSDIYLPTGFAKLTLSGVTYTYPVVFGPEGSEPLLGHNFLQYMGLIVDPRGHQILPRSMLDLGRPMSDYANNGEAEAHD